MYRTRSTQNNIPCMLLLICVSLLVIAGIVFVYSSSSIYAYSRLADSSYFFKRQCIGILLGLIGAIIASHIPEKILQRYAPYAFLIILCFTALTLVSGFGVGIHGAKRWLNMGYITLQPSELLKYAFVVYLAYMLEKSNGRPLKLQVYIQLLCIMLITGGILLAQPDFGTTLLLCLTGMFMAYTANMRIKHVLWSLIILLPLIVILIVCAPYRFKRIVIFLNPWQDPNGAGFQIIQSFIAIGSGGAWGLGIGQSKQKFFYLPMQHTDFIFSIIAEEIGFFGSCSIVICYALFFYAGLKSAYNQEDLFARYVITGCIILLSLQALINISVTIGLLPTKGIGLPFVSYGNSSLAMAITVVGLVIGLAKERKKKRH